MNFDVFNGDADGICALIQLRLDRPLNATLITGIKRDIALLDKFTPESNDRITVLDISFEKNGRRVKEFLQLGAHIFYVDHHRPGEIPAHPKLTAQIDTDSATCTSLIVNRYLQGKFPLWAVTAAFGDNLNRSAEQLAATLQVPPNDLETLSKLGIYVNYNGYGSNIEDLHFAPDQLYREMAGFQSPFEFIAEKPDIFAQLEQGYCEDMAAAQSIDAEYRSGAAEVFILPDTAWARRVSGVFGNYLANLNPDKAHAVLSYNRNGGYQVSVRAPLCNPAGADVLCSAFTSGGGRKAAAGINHLPYDELNHFIRQLDTCYS